KSGLKIMFALRKLNPIRLSTILLVKVVPDFSDQQSNVEESEVDRAPEESGDEKESGGVLAQLSSFQRNESFKVRGMIKGQRIVALIDTGATHNFIDEVVVAKKGLQTEEFEGFK
ncbi:hypothetical protein KI387_002826, partial [Taxus chinensis]